MRRKKTASSEAPPAQTGRKRRQMSISTRLFLSIMIIVLMFVFTIILVDSRLMNGVYIFSSIWKLWDLNDTMNELYEEDPDRQTLLAKLSEIESVNGVSIEIFDENDRLIFSSASPGHVYGYETDPALAREYEVLASGAIGSARHFELQLDAKSDIRMEYIVYNVQLENGYTALFYKMKTPMDESAQVAVQFIVYTAIALVFAAAIVVRIFSLRFTKPLKNISSITHDMSRLDFSTRCPPSNTREIALLSDSINEMSESLNVALEDLKAKNQKLQDDFEKEKTLEQLRTDFISGVSHELKTPIAIIRGYAEGMQYFVDSDPDAAKQYVDTIISETDRMNSLVMKLLEIIRYDSGEYVINQDRFDVHEMVQDWFDRSAERLNDRGVRYENHIPMGYSGMGDSMLISSVVNNYLSNALSHVDGERVLRAWAEELTDVYRVSIFNTGTPIAEKDIDMIWKSFYRADKSMSRAEGRFGLGLTIVASIQRMHGMQFGVENLSDGVRFWFDVKKAAADPSETGESA